MDIKHNDYISNAHIWKRCRDVLDGQDAIHAAGTTYLPRLDKQDDAQYAAYVQRARFFNASYRTVTSMLGLALRKPIDIEPSDEFFEDDVAHAGVSMSEYVAQVLYEVLAVGRAGTLLDYPATNEGMTVAQAESANIAPIWAFYTTENIYNWHFEYVGNLYQLTYVLLFEGEKETSLNSNSYVYKYRELVLEEGVYIQRTLESTSLDSMPEQVGEDILPQKNGEYLDHIPFYFHMSSVKVDEIPKPPLLDLFNANVKHYQLKADHAHALHYVALPTPWCAGVDAEEAPETIGPQRIWSFSSPDVTVGMLEFTGQGVTAIKAELDSIETSMAQLGSRLLSPEAISSNETATATTIKSIGENSSLSAIVKKVSAQFTALWTDTLEWMAKPVTDVSVGINTDFLPNLLSGADLTAVVSSWQSGAISKETLFYNLQQGEVVPPDTTFDEEQALIDEELVNLGTSSTSDLPPDDGTDGDN